MHTLSYVLGIVAILGNAVTYGTDTFAAVVWRTSLRHLDNAALTKLVGYVHHYGDRRLPLPGTLGFVAACLSLVASFLAGRTEAVVAGAVAVVALAVWLFIYVRVAKPINDKFTAAALAGETLEDARGLQASWDRFIDFRVVVQMVALAALGAALALP